MLILTSATLDEDHLAKNFGVDMSKQFIKLDTVQTSNVVEFPRENPVSITNYII
jgi:hypothetical protein